MTQHTLASPADRVMIEDRYLRNKEVLRVYAHLISVAGQGKTTGYSDVSEIMGLLRSGHHMAQQTGQMLGEISKRELECGRSLLSVVVVHAQDRKPGPGFFRLASLLSLLPEDADTDEQHAFLKAQQDAVFAEWKK